MDGGGSFSGNFLVGRRSRLGCVNIDPCTIEKLIIMHISKQRTFYWEPTIRETHQYWMKVRFCTAIAMLLQFTEDRTQDPLNSRKQTTTRHHPRFRFMVQQRSLNPPGVRQALIERAGGSNSVNSDPSKRTCQNPENRSSGMRVASSLRQATSMIIKLYLEIEKTHRKSEGKVPETYSLVSWKGR